MKAHADALENIVEQRGGLESIKLSNPQLALLINLYVALSSNQRGKIRLTRMLQR